MILNWIVYKLARGSGTRMLGLGLMLLAAVIRVKAADNICRWERFERIFQSTIRYDNPFQDASLRLELKSPSGRSHTVDGFWDGNQNWRVRFRPDELGEWHYSTVCSDGRNKGLHDQRGVFTCVAGGSSNRFSLHGPVQISPDHRSLAHVDGTPFFWLADTAWNGALLSTPDEWEYYIRERVRQKFSAVQWVATHWRAAPKGDREKQLAYTGGEKITINPAFFQRLDEKVNALDRAGLLNAPVLLWAIGGGQSSQVNPGVSLPEDQAIRLARYMVARWGANNVVWILAGDGDYRGQKASRWKHIGEAVFGGRPHAPVVMHPGGMQWILDDFKDEKWMDVLGYQSGHGDDEKTLRWMLAGPLVTDWKKEPARPFINLEPPYEYHVAYQSRTRITPETVRRAVYWTLLNAPTAGTSYGGHGVWGWDDGTQPPADHAGTGIPLPWKQALLMPAAEQMAHLYAFFNSIDFWRLRPAPQILSAQPGDQKPQRYIAAARADAGDLVVVYVPEDRMVEVRLNGLPPSVDAGWFNPRTGERNPVVAVVNADSVQFATPAEGDWLLLLKTAKK